MTIQAENAGDKVLRSWMNVSTVDEVVLSLDMSLSPGEQHQGTLDFIANGTVSIEVVWVAQGEELTVLGIPVFEDSFRSRVVFHYDAARCHANDVFFVNSTAAYTRSDVEPLAPLLHHGLTTSTDYEGCEGRGAT